MIAFCSDQQRRNLVLQKAGLNGLDYLEVLGPVGCGNQLALTFLKNAQSLVLTADNISITGDTVLQVKSIQLATSEDPLTITVDLSGSGDFSPYTLTLVKDVNTVLIPGQIPNPPAGIDSQLNSVSFSFKAACPTPVDCNTVQCCPSNLATPPDIHYLARDFAGLRQAMLDRISVLVPTWTETHESDPGITLVEALAYAADRVSYLQDAINTEAYIGTARSRISLRRHARLVDYQVSEGANARAWVCLAAAKTATVPSGTQFFPLVPGLPASIDPNRDIYQADLLLNGPGPVFESMETVTIYKEQNSMEFYTWGDGGCCLPIGTTQATLAGKFTSLAAGQVLIFEEVLGPNTGFPADADPTHRWAVRLTYVSTTDNPTDPVNATAKLTSIAWNAADALPFPLCIASITSAGVPTSGVSVARGNVVAADQGTWTVDESLGAVPPAPLQPVAGVGCNCSPVAGAAPLNPRFDPVLANQPLTFAVPYYPAVSITSVTLTGTVAQIAAVNACIAGEEGTFAGLTGGDCAALNGQVFSVLAAGLTPGSFEVHFTGKAGGPYPQSGAAFSTQNTYTVANPPALLPPSASSFLAPDLSAAEPQISVTSDDGNIWLPTEDLLSKTSEQYFFIPEIEWDGTAHLRFGDGTYGEAPQAGPDGLPGANFSATYRTGNGAAGNVGREALAHVLIAGDAITGVRNPLAAAGGVDPESMQHIVQVAPFAFQSQMRCVTAADYGTMAAALPGVSEAQGTLRWTGSWYSAFVSIDPATTWTTDLSTQVETSLNMLRMMGTDLVVEPAVFIGIRIALEICVAPSFFQADVYAAVWQLLVTGDSCTGTPGLLNAANFQFGQTVYASPIVAAAQQVVGVAAVTLQIFERMDSPTAQGLAPPTQLLMGAVEIPRCDNDPNHADHGLLVLTMDGGK